MINLGIDYLPENEIVKKANAFLKQYHPANTFPVPIEEIIEFQLGLNIIPLPNLQRDYDIEGFSAKDFTEIFVDDYVQQKRPYRYRFTLAHEIGHFVLHKDIFMGMGIDIKSTHDWYAFIAGLNPIDHDKLEYQGNAFAGYLLVPREELRKLFISNLPIVMPLIEEAKSKGIEKKAYLDYAISMMSSILPSDFDVSSGVIERRIKKETSLLNLIP